MGGRYLCVGVLQESQQQGSQVCLTARSWIAETGKHAWVDEWLRQESRRGREVPVSATLREGEKNQTEKRNGEDYDSHTWVAPTPIICSGVLGKVRW